MTVTDSTFLTPLHLWHDTPDKRARPGGAEGLNEGDLVTLLEAIDPVMLLLNLAGWETPHIIIQRRSNTEKTIEIGLPQMEVSTGMWSTSVGMWSAGSGDLGGARPNYTRIAVGCKERTQAGAMSGMAIPFEDGLLVRGPGEWSFMVLHAADSDDPSIYLRNVFAAAEEGRVRLVPKIAECWKNPRERVKDSNVGLLGMYNSALWNVLSEKGGPRAAKQRQSVLAFGARMWAVLCKADIQEFLAQETLPRAFWLSRPPGAGSSTEESQLAALPMGLAQEELDALWLRTRQNIFSLRRRTLDWGYHGWLRGPAGGVPVDSSTDTRRLTRAEAGLLLEPWFKWPMPFRAADVRQKTYTRILLASHAHGAIDVLSGLSTQSREQIEALLSKQSLASTDISTLCQWVHRGVFHYSEAWRICSRLEMVYGTDEARELRQEIRHALIYGSTFAYPDTINSPADSQAAPIPEPGTFVSSWIESLSRVLAGTSESGAALELLTWTNELQITASFSEHQYPSNLVVALLILFRGHDDPRVRGFAALYSARIWSALLPAEYAKVPLDDSFYAQLCAMARRVEHGFSERGMLQAYLRTILFARRSTRLHDLCVGDIFGDVWNRLLNRASAAGSELASATEGPLHVYYNCIAGYAYFGHSATSESWQGRLDLVALIRRMQELESDPQVVRVMETAWREALDECFGSGGTNSLLNEHEAFIRSHSYLAYLSVLEPAACTGDVLHELKRVALLDQERSHELFKALLGALVLTSPDLLDAVDHGERVQFIREALTLMGYEGDPLNLATAFADTWGAGATAANEWARLKDTKWEAFHKGRAGAFAGKLLTVASFLIAIKQLKEFETLDSASVADVAAWAKIPFAAVQLPYSVFESFAAEIPDLSGQPQLIQRIGGAVHKTLGIAEKLRKPVGAFGGAAAMFFGLIGYHTAVAESRAAWSRGEWEIGTMKALEAGLQLGTAVVGLITVAEIVATAAVVGGPATSPLWAVSATLTLAAVGLTVVQFGYAWYNQYNLDKALIRSGVLYSQTQEGVCSSKIDSGIVKEIYVEAGKYVLEGERVATVIWHPDVKFSGPLPAGAWMQAAVAEHFAEERAKAIKVRQEGKEDVVRALFGCKVVSALGPDSAFARPGDLVVGEPRFSFVVKAPRSGTLNSLRVKVGDKIGAASVLGSVGDVSITSPVEGIILTLLVLDGAFVKKDDMIAWVYSPHNFVWTVYER